jgi:hypothetical protein
MVTFGLESLPMLERYLLKAVAIGDIEEAERLRQQILTIKGPSERPRNSYAFGATPPLDPVEGDMWLESDEGVFYIYVVDAGSGQWIEV